MFGAGTENGKNIYHLTVKIFLNQFSLQIVKAQPKLSLYASVTSSPIIVKAQVTLELKMYQVL